MNAATHLSSLDGARRPLVPAAIPLPARALHLGRLRSCLDGAETVAAAAGVASAACVGLPTEPAQNLGRLGYRSEARVDERGRLVLDRRVWGVDRRSERGLALIDERSVRGCPAAESSAAEVSTPEPPDPAA